MIEGWIDLVQCLKKSLVTKVVDQRKFKLCEGKYDCGEVNTLGITNKWLRELWRFKRYRLFLILEVN